MPVITLTLMLISNLGCSTNSLRMLLLLELSEDGILQRRQLDFTGQKYIMKLQRLRQPPRNRVELNGLQTKFDSVSQLVNDFDAMKMENTEKKHCYLFLLLFGVLEEFKN